jgi:signal transduction histidine kinase
VASSEELAVAQIVHDLRNQLTVMMGCADALAFLVPRGEADRQIAQLRKSAERASQLAREILLATGPGTRARVPVDLNDVVSGARSAILRLAGQAHRIELELAPEPVTVMAHSSEVEAILVMLVRNALETMGTSGSITIATTAQATGMPCAKLTVRERGGAPATRDGGSLSSLAVTVGLLRGHVSIEPCTDGGTAVSVALPLAPR